MTDGSPSSQSPPPRAWLGAAVWAAGVPGVVAAAVYLPTLVAALGDDPLGLPWWAPVAAGVQSGLMLAVAAATGAALAPRLGLRAPVAEALASGRPVGPALRPQLVPGLAGAAVGTALLLALAAVAPDAISALDGRFDPPLWLRVLYGGVTEEVLVRWGVMTAAVWVGWRLVQRRQGAPRPVVVWSAIAVSSLVFGAGHLPIAAQLAGPLTPAVVAYVVLGNSAFGVVAGWLYWRHGLEAAVLAHAGTHLGVVALAALAS